MLCHHTHSLFCIGRPAHAAICQLPLVVLRVVFVGGGSRGTSPSLDMTFRPTGLSENLGGMERGRGGKEEREGWGRPRALLPPPLASASNTTLVVVTGQLSEGSLVRKIANSCVP